MNEDYLYNKIGEDAEIESLENLLKGFRLQSTNAPRLPVNIAVFQPKPGRKVYRYVFAIAASLLIAVTIGIRAKFAHNENTFVADKIEFTEVKETPKDKNASDNVKLRQAENIGFNPTNKSTNKSNRKLIMPTKFVQKALFIEVEPKLKRQIQPKKVSQIKQSVKFTDEEKFAYEQLKLALSITGSNLKTVKEKIDNKEVETSALNNKVVTK